MWPWGVVWRREHVGVGVDDEGVNVGVAEDVNVRRGWMWVSASCGPLVACECQCGCVCGGWVAHVEMCACLGGVGVSVNGCGVASVWVRACVCGWYGLECGCVCERWVEQGGAMLGWLGVVWFGGSVGLSWAMLGWDALGWLVGLGSVELVGLSRVGLGWVG